MKSKIILITAIAAISVKAPPNQGDLAQFSFPPYRHENKETFQNIPESLSLSIPNMEPKDVIDLAKQNIYIIQSDLRILRPPYTLGNVDNELAAKLCDLKEKVMEQGLFGYETDYIIQDEVADKFLKGRPLNEDTARASIESLNQSYKAVSGYLWRIDNHLQTRKIHTISLAQLSEIKYICEKFQEVAECFKRLCKILDPDMQDIPEHTMQLPEILDVD